jgi:hypothetical protein
VNRETWLTRAADLLRPDFRDAGAPLPADLAVSCGWPTRRALRTANSASRVIGQCFHPAASAGQITEVFVSPAISESPEVLAILAHELCHAALFAEHPDAGHGPLFRKLAKAIGLTGPMRATVAGPHLERRAAIIIGQLGEEYPHAGLDLEATGKKQSTRLIKLQCPECDYTIRTTRQWIATGVPTCPCGAEFEAPAAGRGKSLIKVFGRAERKKRK